MSEEPNVDQLMLKLNDPIFRAVIENVLIGSLKMEWNGGEPTFQMAEQGERHVESLLKGN